MAQVVAAFGTSHSTMLVSSVEHWQEMFDRVDRRAWASTADRGRLSRVHRQGPGKMARGSQSRKHQDR
jgi:hypothetical protein